MRAFLTTGIHETNARVSVIAVSTLFMVSLPPILGATPPSAEPGMASLSLALACWLLGFWLGDRFVPLEGFSRRQWAVFLTGVLAALAMLSLPRLVS